MKIMLVIYYLVAFLLLIAAAVLQMNDPDPLFWGGFYFSCSLIPLLAVFKIKSRIFYAVCVIYGIAVIGPTIDGFFEYLQHANTESLLMKGMSMSKPYIEEAREFLGALIAFGLITTSMFARSDQRLREKFTSKD